MTRLTTPTETTPQQQPQQQQGAPAEQQRARLNWRCISLWNPYAFLMACGLKKCETRGRAWDYRGPLLIHATAGVPAEFRDWARELLTEEPFAADLRAQNVAGWDDLPHGAILAAGCFTGAVRTDAFDEFARQYPSKVGPTPGDRQTERAYGDYSPGRYFMPFTLGHRLATPVACRGSQALWAPPAEVALAVEAQIPEYVLQVMARGALTEGTREVAAMTHSVQSADGRSRV